MLSPQHVMAIGRCGQFCHQASTSSFCTASKEDQQESSWKSRKVRKTLNSKLKCFLLQNASVLIKNILLFFKSSQPVSNRDPKNQDPALLEISISILTKHRKSKSKTMDTSISESLNTIHLHERSPMDQNDSFHPTPNTAHLTPQDSPPSVNKASEAAMPKKRGRKGHSKSRAGCFNCKKARIKVWRSDRKQKPVWLTSFKPV